MPELVLVSDPEHQMAAGAGDAGRCPDAHPRKQQLDLGAERLERGLQQEVLLEAIPAAVFGHELSLEVLGRQRHRDAPARIEVLERDGGGVRPMDPRRCWLAAQADAGQVGVEIAHAPESTSLRPPAGALCRRPFL